MPQEDLLKLIICFWVLALISPKTSILRSIGIAVVYAAAVYVAVEFLGFVVKEFFTAILPLDFIDSTYLGLVVFAVLSWKYGSVAIENMLRFTDDNTVVGSTNPWWFSFGRNKRTKYNWYFPGYHIVWFWEKWLAEKVSLVNFGTLELQKFTVTTSDGYTATINGGQGTCRLDENRMDDFVAFGGWDNLKPLAEGELQQAVQRAAANRTWEEIEDQTNDWLDKAVESVSRDPSGLGKLPVLLDMFSTGEADPDELIVEQRALDKREQLIQKKAEEMVRKAKKTGKTISYEKAYTLVSANMSQDGKFVVTGGTGSGRVLVDDDDDHRHT